MIDSGRRKNKSIIIAFLAPTILLYAALFVYPTVQALQLSLYDWKGLNVDNARFVGLANFAEAAQDRWVHVGLRNTMLIIVAGGILLFTFALIFAAALTNTRVKGKGIFRTLIFFPYTLSGPGVGLLWVFILNPSFGALNGLLRAVGLDTWARPWLGETVPALGAVIFVSVWWSIGFYMLFLVAGIQSIPSDLFDAARVDGAGEDQLFFRLTLPLLRDFMAVAVVLWIIEALKTFAVIFLLTQGGPANQTHVLTTYMVKMALGFGGTPLLRLGYGTSIAVILLALVFLSSLLFFRLSRQEAIEF
jgi:N-acetylglucosamine transport system permease protein